MATDDFKVEFRDDAAWHKQAARMGFPYGASSTEFCVCPMTIDGWIWECIDAVLGRELTPDEKMGVENRYSSELAGSRFPLGVAVSMTFFNIRGPHDRVFVIRLLGKQYIDAASGKKKNGVSFGVGGKRIKE